MQPAPGSQLSAVHAFPSSQLRGSLTQVWLAVQRSLTVHWSASAHSTSELQHAGTGMCWQPVSFKQLSTVQKLRSSQSGGVPDVQVRATQVSWPSQALPSEQLVPSSRGVWTQPVAGLHE